MDRITQLQDAIDQVRKLSLGKAYYRWQPNSILP